MFITDTDYGSILFCAHFTKEDMHMEKISASLRSCLQPSPKVLVSCCGNDGECDALAVAYCCNCSYDPPMVMVGIVPSRYSYHLIKESGCFTVNLVGKEYQEKFDYLGSHSKRDGDKIAACGAHLEPGIKVRSPYLAGCPVHIECTVTDSVVTGSHEMFIGKVESVFADKEFVGEDGKIDFSAIDFL
jgi:flavin reductase (DIM6/NTAB) family NADH-FMN oxidoreductase RutF